MPGGRRCSPARHCSVSGSRCCTSSREYFLAPQASSKQGTYGSLGLAALLLLGLFLISRLMIGTAVLNATLWTRHKRSLESTAGAAGTSEAPDVAP